MCLLKENVVNLKCKKNCRCNTKMEPLSAQLMVCPVRNGRTLKQNASHRGSGSVSLIVTHKLVSPHATPEELPEIQFTFFCGAKFNFSSCSFPLTFSIYFIFYKKIKKCHVHFSKGIEILKMSHIFFEWCKILIKVDWTLFYTI